MNADYLLQALPIIVLIALRSHGHSPTAGAFASALPHTTPGLALWDVCNEPHPEWYEFVLHFVAYFQTKTATPTTVGVTQWSVLNASIATDGGSKTIGEAVDVLTYHSCHSSLPTHSFSNTTMCV